MWLLLYLSENEHENKLLFLKNRKSTFGSWHKVDLKGNSQVSDRNRPTSTNSTYFESMQQCYKCHYMFSGDNDSVSKTVFVRGGVLYMLLENGIYKDVTIKKWIRYLKV